MSGIYIHGMEMPVTCCHCPLMGYDPDREWYDSMAQTGAHICVLTGELIDNTKREEHCPLVPVPPHGRLIDADALLNEGADLCLCEYDDENTWGFSYDMINDAPTIISADPEKEET